MAVIVINEAISVEGLERLLEQYKGKAAFETLLQMYLDSVQELEDATFNVRLAFMLENAEGEQLDILGAIVGEARNGKEDAVYAVWIGVRIRLNRSFGTAIDIIECLRLATDVEFEFREYADACFAVIFSELPEFPNDLTLIAHLAKAAGVGLTFIYPANEDTAHVFLFRHVDDPSDPDHGLAHEGDL